MSLRIAQSAVDAIRHHGQQTYPSECCGMLLGRVEGAQKEVTRALPMDNLRRQPERADQLLPRQAPDRESERNRFLIDPKQQMQVEREARAQGWEVLGYYHSHPDHPARPSDYDREYGWPWYSYVIIGVDQGKPREMTSWVLKEDRSGFDPEPWESF